MKLRQRVAREFRGYNLVEGMRRLFDDKPLQCQLYLTDQCNLDCAYCTEYDNSQEHPSLDDLKSWLRKIRDLGTMRLALVGGEPLMHPDVVEVVRYARDIGLATSLTTNGFLLTKSLVRRLEDAGLQVMQISVDRVTPSPVTRKSLKTILPKLDLFTDSPISLHISGVVCEDTLEESRQVLLTGLELGIPTEIRLLHADPAQTYRVAPGSREKLEELLRWMVDEKARGVPIHTNEAILQYQLDQVQGNPVEWTCTAGFKLFFVSAQGKFWLCSMVPTQQHILDVQPQHMIANYRKKDCQEGCGIYCVISASMIYQQPLRVLTTELAARARRIPAILRSARRGPRARTA